MWQRPHTNDGIFEQARLDAESLSRDARPIACPDGRIRLVLSAGTGPAIVFVPIVNHVNFVWAPQIERFSRSRQVILFEPQVSTEINVSLSDRAAEIATILDALGVETADVVAWSDGGSAAYIFAATWPERCRSIAFIGLADRFSFTFPIGNAMRFFRRFQVDRFIPEWVIHRFLIRFLSGAVARPDFVKSRVRTIPQTGRLAKYSLLPCLLDHRPQRGEVRTPAIMICGDHDALVSVKQARRMAELLPNCTSVNIIRNGEHFLPYTSATEVNACLENFLLLAEGGEPVVDRRADKPE